MPTPVAEEGAGNDLSARAAVGWLAGIVSVSIAVRVVLAAEVDGPFVFKDELGYQRLAWSLAHTGQLALFGKTGLSYSPLYSVVLAPVYLAVHSAQSAYAWTKVVNAVLMSLSALPVYAIARTLASRRLSLVAAGVSTAAPLMYFTSLAMSENLAYPLFLVAVWVILRGVRDPGPRHDAFVLGAILLATAARIQLVVLVPAVLTAIAALALLRPESGGRAGAVAFAFRRHWLLAAVTVAGLAGALARRASTGGGLPLAGRYSNVGSARASPQRVLELAVQHLAGLDLAVGVVPFAGALLAGYVLARRGFPREPLVFASVAVAVTAWLLLETALDAAAFDRPPADLPRIHERYLIYLVPLFVVALVAVLRAGRDRVPLHVHLAIATVSALLPATIPFGQDINNTIVADSFALQLYGRNVGGKVVPIAHPTLTAVGFAAVLALVYLYAFLRPRPTMAIAVTLVAFLFMTTLVRARMVVAAAGSTELNLPARKAWVDRAVPPSAHVVLVGGGRTWETALWETAFENFSVTRLYHTCGEEFGEEFGERPLTVGRSGRLLDGVTPVLARYVVAPVAFAVRGRLLAVDSKGGLALVAPADGLLRVPPVLRRVVACAG